ncbi:Vitamin B12 import ATP-binding protein BtuD [Streptomyces violarus]
MITTIIGPNGCGKSTLLRTLSRLLKPSKGTVVLDGDDIARLRTRDVARKLGLLPQAPVAPEGLTVADLVARGRHPHQSWLRQWSSDDADVVERALAMTGVSDLADRPVDALSGGQRQRVWISMTLAQGTDLLLLDEPTTYLDLAHAMDVLSWYENSVAPFTSTDVRGRLVTGIGFKYQTEIDKVADGSFYTKLSPERVDLVDVDRIFVINDKADTAALKKFKLFANLDAVKKGNVSYLLDSEGPAVGAAISQGTLLSMPYAVDELVKSVAE